MNEQSDSIERWSRELREGFEKLRYTYRHRKREPLAFVEWYESFKRILEDFENFDKWEDQATLTGMRTFVDQTESNYQSEKERLEKKEFWNRFYNERRPWDGGRADGNG